MTARRQARADRGGRRAVHRAGRGRRQGPGRRRSPPRPGRPRPPPTCEAGADLGGHRGPGERHGRPVRPDGERARDVVDAVVDGRRRRERMVFEAPRKDQQAWLVRRFGADVNLGNIAPAEVLGRGGAAARAARRHRRRPPEPGARADDRDLPRPLPRGVGHRRRRRRWSRAAARAATSRPVYRRTRYVVVRRGAETALVEVDAQADRRALFSPIVGRRCCWPGPDETRVPAPPRRRHRRAQRSWLGRGPDAPPARGASSSRGATGTSASSSTRAPVRVHVLDVVPPRAGQAARPGRAGAARPPRTCPPIVLVPRVVELADLLPAEPAGALPAARAAAAAWRCPGADVCLPRRASRRGATGRCSAAPAPAASTTASTSGAGPPGRHLPAARCRPRRAPAGEVLLTKCCLLEEHIEVDGPDRASSRGAPRSAPGARGARTARRRARPGAGVGARI